MRFMLVRIVLAAAFAAAFAPPSEASAQVIVGRVVDAESRSPIAGADLEIRNDGGGTVATATSDSTGFVRATLPAAGAYVLAARRLAYLDYTSSLVRVEEGETIEVEIRLGRDAIPLEPLLVVTRARRAGRLEGYRGRLRDGGFARFVTREEIEARPNATVTDLIRPVAGVSIVEVPRGTAPYAMSRLVAMRGTRTGEIPGAPDMNGCLPGLFLDGIRVEQSAEFPVDDFITSGSLEGIEVYSSASSVPIEFQQGGSVACGAVLLWTREADPGQGRSGWWRWALGITGFAGIVFLMR